MKKMLLVLGVLGAVLVSGSAFAAQQIVNSKHNLSNTNPGYVSGASVASSSNKLCEHCHAPHNALVAVPLWNRINPSGFKLYTASSTLSDAAKSATLISGSISLQCLSCHASVKGQAASAAAPYSLLASNSNLTDLKVAGIYTGTWQDGGFSTNLTDDHPIGFNYATAETTRVANGGTVLVDMATAVTNGAKFFNSAAGQNQMECSSCHKVHDKGDAAAGTYPFLRKANVGSALCRACHTN